MKNDEENLLSILAVPGSEMKRNLSNNKKEKNVITTTTTRVVWTTAIILIVAVTTISSTPPLLLAYAWIDPDQEPVQTKAPSVITGENVYVVWWTDQGTENANGEVMFRASSDSGATFSNSTNLSNTTDADSVDAEIAAEGDSVIVTWWERNQTSDAPVARISTDGGDTFGPLIMLGANGTVSGVEEEEGEGEGEGEEEDATAEGVIEEQVGGGPEVAE
jgi:hypothetical protein